MILELLRAIAAAVIMLGVPSYIWSRALCRTDDWIERTTLTVATALAVVVPAVLLFARIFGPAVSLPIVVASIALVATVGVLLYLTLGEPHPDAQKAKVDPLPLPSTSLVGFIGAVVLMLAVLVRLVPIRPVTSYIAAMMVAVGALSLGKSGQQHLGDPVSSGPDTRLSAGMDDNVRPSAAPEGRTRGLGVLTHPMLPPMILLLVLVRGYAGPVHHDWPYLRGLDQYPHSIMTELVLKQGDASSFTVYPPGFHFSTAMLYSLSGLDPLRLYTVLAPALLVFPALSSYLLTRNIFGQAAAVLSMLLVGGLLPSPAVMLNDGMYPNLIAGQFLLVVTVSLLVKLLQAPSLRNGFLLAIIGSSVVLYHTISSLYLVLVLGLVSILWLPYLLWKDRRTGHLLLVSLALLGVLSVAYTWDTYELPQTVAALLGEGGPSYTVELSTAMAGERRPPDMIFLGFLASQPVLWFGLLGALLLGLRLRAMPTPQSLVVALLLAWTTVQFIAARTSLSGFPVRFARDLGLFLSILAAFALLTILRSYRRGMGLDALAVLLAVAVVSVQLGQSFAATVRPSRQLFLTPDIAAAGDWLRAHSGGGSIIVSPHISETPTNAMLAMGGYSGLRAIPVEQLQGSATVRDKQRAEDVLWVIQHPEHQRTITVLEHYDVRYVVLYKSFRKQSVWYSEKPEVWNAFRQASETYYLAFENEQVVIFEVRR